MAHLTLAKALWAKITLLSFSLHSLLLLNTAPFVIGTTDGTTRSLQPRAVSPGAPVASGVDLRILPLGDSITWGYGSPDGNGYRLKLYNDLSGNDVVFAGTVQHGNMVDNWCAGYPGKTIQYIAGQAGASLVQKPNVVLLLAGTNDMNPNPATSTEGTDAGAAAQRLGSLVDKIFDSVPGVVVLLAKLPNVADAKQEANTQAFNAQIPNVVSQRAASGQHIRLVDLSTIGSDLLQPDGIHPSPEGYITMANIWFQAIAAIPAGWVKAPSGPDPDHPLNCDGSNALSPVVGGGQSGSLTANGGPDPNIPDPVFDHSKLDCEVALGVGHPGNWKYTKKWVSGGKIVSGLGLDIAGVQLYDMDGDGKAEYLWVNEDTGQLTCWKNNWPDLWAPCGNNGGIIASGAGPRDAVFFADMNADGKTDYLVVDASNGAVTVYWNEGPDANFVNGWRFTPGGVIATGVPHANLRTLRFADMNGDGRADYVIVGEGGSLGLWLNTGTQGGHDVLFVAQGGIATGASSNIDNIELSDINGDGRADYLVWDNVGGMSGFLNIRTRDAGTPFFAPQGGAKSIADGIQQLPLSIRLADIDGDGLLDYCYLDSNGALWIWWNRGSSDASVTGDGVRLADIDGDGLDDYIWLDEATGAPVVYLNKGEDAGFPDGWHWAALDGGKPIASGAGPRGPVHFGDIDGDNRTDYLVLDPKTGEVTAYLNKGLDFSAPNSWRWKSVGSIASGLGPGENARFADIDGDGKADYIQLSLGGKAVVWKNNYPKPWSPLAKANAAGIGRPPQEISFADIDGDGRADYIWTDPLTGQPHVWYNKLPSAPAWSAGPYQSVTAEGVSGQCVIYGKLEKKSGAQPVFVNPDNGAIAAFVGGCSAIAGLKRNAPASHAKRDIRRRAACGGLQQGSTNNDGYPLITGCPTGEYNPYAGFHNPPPCAKGDWLKVQCTDPPITAAFNPTLWWDADCDTAFQQAMAHWNNYLNWPDKQGPDLDFSNVVSNYFHGPRNFECSKVEDPTVCVHSLECPSTNYPAGYIILDSLATLHGFGLAVHESLGGAVDTLQNLLDEFVSTFTREKPTSAISLIIDGVVLAASLGFAGVFVTAGKFIQNAAKGLGPRSYEASKDFALTASGSVNGFSKDLFNPATQDDTATAISVLIEGARDAFNQTSIEWFDELLNPKTPDMQDLITSYMGTGELLDTSNVYNTDNLQRDTERALWGILFNRIWFDSPDPVYPFVLRIPANIWDCHSGVISTDTTHGAIPGDKREFADLVDIDTYKTATRASFCDENGNSFFLVDGGHGKWLYDCNGSELDECEGQPYPSIKQLPGGNTKTLAPGNKFGGVTIADMVKSSWTGYRENGYQNGYKMNASEGFDPGPSTAVYPVNITYGNNIYMPGFFNFPVCVSVDQFWKVRRKVGNGNAYTIDPNYPCGLTGGSDIVDRSTYLD